MAAAFEPIPFPMRSFAFFFFDYKSQNVFSVGAGVPTQHPVHRAQEVGPGHTVRARMAGEQVRAPRRNRQDLPQSATVAGVPTDRGLPELASHCGG